MAEIQADFEYFEANILKELDTAVLALLAEYCDDKDTDERHLGGLFFSEPAYKDKESNRRGEDQDSPRNSRIDK